MFNNLWNEIDRVYRKAATKMGLSDSAMIILYNAKCGGGECMLSDITHLSGISKQTVNSSLRKLEAEGIIYLETVGLRKKKICLSKKGKEFAEKTVGTIIGAEEKIYNSWTKEELDLFLRLNQRFLTEFKKETEEM